jgi:hypothetical protein
MKYFKKMKISWKENLPKDNIYFETENEILYNCDNLVVTNLSYKVALRGNAMNEDRKY